MSYAVKEIFLTLQGEGGQAGRPAVFCRFAGCNLWTGREADRAKAVCQFCDTDFVGVDGEGGGRFKTADVLARACRDVCPSSEGKMLVVLTGGEPMLQVDQPLVDALHANGFTIAIETNGTLPVLDTIDWICVSPKAGSELKQHRGQELKLVYPQDGVDPAQYLGLAFDYRFLQPMDGPARAANTQAAVASC
jgi:7-carboxy-7-deazaguanine synthase (Cx14CxxC type)